VSGDDADRLLASEAPHRQGDLVLYDYFKHLTTMSLLVLGGVLTLSQTDKGAEMKLATLLMVVGVVTLAGLVSFSASGEIARAHFHGEEPKRIDLYRKAAPMLLLLGVGMFLFLFGKALGR
jgi:surface polysaccharide O-acyltransferase-like enzyme